MQTGVSDAACNSEAAVHGGTSPVHLSIGSRCIRSKSQATRDHARGDVVL